MNDRLKCCPKHVKAVERFESARRNWTIMRKDPEPMDKIMRITRRLWKSMSKCNDCLSM